MSFHHVPTFLKSALARNPFCHGDVISVEDVLRLEAKFPALFDKPKPEVKPEEHPDIPTAATLVQSKASASPAKSQSRPKDEGSPRRKLIRAPVKKAPIVPNVATKSPVKSKFHKNCVVPASAEGEENKPRPPIRINAPKAQFPQANPESNLRTLSRPAQTFCVEDLREALKEMMRAEDEILNRKPTKETPSPYSEDLVKKFLGRKIREAREQDERRARDEMRQQRGQGDAIISPMKGCLKNGDNHGRPCVQPQPRKYVPHSTLTQHHQHPAEQSKMYQIPRIRSAPGFLRTSPESRPAHRRRNACDHARARTACEGKRVIWEQQRSGPMKLAHHGTHNLPNPGMETMSSLVDSVERRIRPENEVRMKDSRFYEKSENVINEPRREEDGSKALRISGRRKGTQIHLHSQKKDTPADGQQQVDVGGPQMMPKSCFQDLLSARAMKSKMETKQTLRKQGMPFTFYMKHANEAKQENYNLPSASQRQRRDNESRKESDKTTKEVLEKIAEELVYTEILHQLRELKQEQELEKEGDEEENKRNSTQSISLSSPNNNYNIPLADMEFVPTSDKESESERKQKKKCKSESSSIVLKTPDLTPPPRVECPTSKVLQGRQGTPLQTPELSPDLRKVDAIGMKHAEERKMKHNAPMPESHKIAQHPTNLDTDCSEMSDFVFSEVNKTKSSSEKKKDESIKLVTPELSNSKISVPRKMEQGADAISKRGDLVEIPGKDEGTLSEVSPLQDSDLGGPYQLENKSDDASDLGNHEDDVKSKSDENVGTEHTEGHVLNDNSMQSDSKSEEYSDDDFLPEKSSPASGSMSYSVEHEEFAGDHEILNTSGETVIDLLSDGEFLGSAHKSPGELSYGQIPNIPRKPSFVRNLFSEGQVSVTSISVTATEDDESDISVISQGAQIVPGNDTRALSVGEYLQPKM